MDRRRQKNWLRSWMTNIYVSMFECRELNRGFHGKNIQILESRNILVGGVFIDYRCSHLQFKCIYSKHHKIFKEVVLIKKRVKLGFLATSLKIVSF